MEELAKSWSPPAATAESQAAAASAADAFGWCRPLSAGFGRSLPAVAAGSILTTGGMAQQQRVEARRMETLAKPSIA